MVKHSDSAPQQDRSYAIYTWPVSDLLVGALHPFHERHGSKDWEGEHPQEH